jgi:quinol monooxygenase YgiN
MRKLCDFAQAQIVARLGTPALILAATLAAGAGALAQAQPAQPAPQTGEVFAVTYVEVSNDWILQGGGLLKQYREQSVKEPGNLEFTVLQEVARPNRFIIMEGWKDDAAFQAHAKGPNASLFNFTLEAIRNAPPDRHMLNAYATAPPRGGAGSGAVYMFEHVDFMGGNPAYGLAAQLLVKALAEASQKEPGALRYDVYQQPAPRTNHYEVVAVWSDAKAYEAHETASHTRQFRTVTVIPTVPSRANLYDQRIYKPID